METCSKFAKGCGKDKGKEASSVDDTLVPVGGSVGNNLAPGQRTCDKQSDTVLDSNVHSKGFAVRGS